MRLEREPTMENRPPDDLNLYEALESCRPDGQDLSDPALAGLAVELAANPQLQDLAGRLRQFDATIAAAFQDVPVPPGLKERLLRHLEEERSKGSFQHLPPSPPTPLPQAGEGSFETALNAAFQRAMPAGNLPHDRRLPARISRRWLVAAVAAFGAAAAILVAALLHIGGGKRATESELLEDAIALFHNQGAEATKPLPAPDDYPLSQSVVQVRGMRWRPVSGVAGCSGVAYDIALPGGGQAMLLVIRGTAANLPARPPSVPAQTTFGCSASAWQEDGLLYVLVVPGDARDYGQLLDLPRGPIT